jgi:Apea-like HEPN
MEQSIKSSLQAIGKQSIEAIENAGQQPGALAGSIALYDTQKDDLFVALPEIESAMAALWTDQRVRAQCREDETKRLTLQLVYRICEEISLGSEPLKAIEAAISALDEELDIDSWRHVAVANLNNFHADRYPLTLANYVSVRGRSKDLIADGLDEYVMQALYDDWLQGGTPSPFVIFAEQFEPKTPDNFIMTSTAVASKIQRALLAMRLLKPGDISSGRIFILRPSKFNVGLGGVSSVGATQRTFGTPYSLDAKDMPGVEETYIQLEALQGTTSTQRLLIALRWFSFIFDRLLGQNESRVVDAFTSLEALVGTGAAEITFKLAFRISSLLAKDDASRAELFDSVRSFYGTRSKIVHGSELKAKDSTLLANDEPLRSLARTLLRGFLTYVSQGGKLDEPFYRDLDARLMTSKGRTELRQQLALV